MLIFFIVTATFVKESGIDVNRPDATTATKQDKANVLIAINAKNEIWIERRRVDVRSVRPNIERLHAENPQVRRDPGRQRIEDRNPDSGHGR